MPKISPEQAQARRDQIIRAALVCTARDGFHQTTIQDICREAELSTGAVYSYFNSKEEIVRAVADVSYEENRSFLEEVTQNEDPYQALDEIVNRYFLRPFAEPHADAFLRVDLNLYAESLRNPEIREVMERNREGIVSQLENFIKNCQATGIIAPDRDARATAQVLFGMHVGMTTQRAVSGNFDVEAYVKSMRKIVGLGLWVEKNE